MFDAFANILSFTVLGLDSASRTGVAVHFFIMDVVKSANATNLPNDRSRLIPFIGN